MLIRTSHDNAPGHCRLCQSAVVPVIDTLRDYDSDGFGGALKICKNCVATMADLMGWTHPDHRADLDRAIEDRDSIIDQLETEAADLAAQLETFKEMIKITQAPATTARRGPGRPRKVAE